MTDESSRNLRDGRTVALVTGASRGLGAAVVRALAVRNVCVIAVARTEGALRELDDSLRPQGHELVLACLDLTDRRAIAGLADSIAPRWGRLDVLVHAMARSTAFAPVAFQDGDELRGLLNVNVEATQSLIAALDPLLRAAPAGRAVFVHDRDDSLAFRGAYAASKAAMATLVEAWRSESRQTALRIALACPPPMATRLRARGRPGEDQSGLARPGEVAERLVDALLATNWPDDGVIDLRE